MKVKEVKFIRKSQVGEKYLELILFASFRYVLDLLILSNCVHTYIHTHTPAHKLE